MRERSCQPVTVWETEGSWRSGDGRVGSELCLLAPKRHPSRLFRRSRQAA